MKNLLFTSLFFIYLSSSLTGANVPFSIIVKSSADLTYCDTPILVASDISISSNIQSITGMKISFGSSDYVYGEDKLDYTPGSVASISGTWYPSQGYLLLQPNGSAVPSISDYEDAMKTIVYKNSNFDNKLKPTLGKRSISITLSDVDYLLETNHFYKYFAKNGISWEEARKAALASDYFGLQGYLATITSDGENFFISQKTKGTGWIGASDKAIPGEWRWVTGPEGGTDPIEGGAGLLFWKSAPGSVGVPYLGRYSNWNYGEPNNFGWEDYAHILSTKINSGVSVKWNNLDISGVQDTTQLDYSGQPAKEYYPRGYLVEYGKPGDNEYNLSANLVVHVNTILYSKDLIPTICEGESVSLNQPDLYSDIKATYLWSNQGITLPITISNPNVNPVIPTIYHVIGTRGSCNMENDFKVTVRPKPKVSFSIIDPERCYGYSVNTVYDNVPGVDPSTLNFTWVFGVDTVQQGLGKNNVIIPLGSHQPPPKVSLNVTDQYGCSNQFIGSDILVKPNLSAWTVNNAEDCLYNQFEFSVTDPGSGALVYDWLFGDGDGATGITSTHRYKITGRYDVQLKVTNNANNCFNSETKKSMVFAEPLPHAEFTMNDSIVYKDQPKVVFTNQSSGASTYEWSFGDYSTPSSETNPIHYYNETGYHTVLLVDHNENLCVDSIKHRVLVAFSRIFPPNAFSPNAPDPKDRIFLPFAEGVRSQGYHLTILSRWDDVIFEVWHQITGWDGKMDNGSFAPPGVYVWRLLYNDFLERPHHQSGTVTLIY